MNSLSMMRKSWDNIGCEKHVMIDILEGELQFESRAAVKGKLHATEAADIYLFEWEPETCAPFSFEACNLEETKFYFFLHDLQSIQVTEGTDSTTVRFLVPKLPSSCYFRFPDPTKLLIVLEELKVKETLVVNPNFDEFLDVKAKCNFEVEMSENYLTFTQVICHHSHRALVDKWKIQAALMDGFGLAEYQKSLAQDGHIENFPKLRDDVFARGLSKEARPYVWPYFFGYYTPEMTTEQKQQKDDRQLSEYEILTAQVDATTDQQKLYDTTLKVIDQDVARPGQDVLMFAKADSPARPMVTHMFRVFDKYDRDTGYVQGMPDIMYLLFYVFVKEVRKDTVLMFDDTEWEMLRAESFVFWNFVNALRLSCQDGLFHDLFHNLPFVAERAFAIAKDHHPIMTNWLMANQLSRLAFLDNTVTIQFCRSYHVDVVSNLWDRIYASGRPCGFIRFLIAAVLFHVFPNIVLDLNSQIDASREVQKTDGMMVLATAIYFYKSNTGDGQNEQLTEWYFMEIPSPHKPVRALPRYFHLWEVK